MPVQFTTRSTQTISTTFLQSIYRSVRMQCFILRNENSENDFQESLTRRIALSRILAIKSRFQAEVEFRGKYPRKATRELRQKVRT